MACAICQVRRPKRFCPGVRGDICTICCGTEREVTVTCPLDCEYLRDARRHEKLTALDTTSLPDRDIRVSEEMLEENQALLEFLAGTLASAALETPGMTDFDLRDTIQALIRTYRTLLSGVYYETRPDNALANRLFGIAQESISEFRAREQQETGLPRTRDADVLALLVFLERLELDRNNGRPRGRAFIDLLHSLHSATSRGAADEGTSSLLLP